MGTATSSIVEELKKLPSEEKLQIIRELWDSIPEPGFELTEEALDELGRRADELQRHPDRGIPWDELRVELLAR